MDALNQQARSAIAVLMGCHSECIKSAFTIVLESDEKGRPQQARLLTDAAAITLATANAISRKSQFHSQFAQLCAAVCDTCAQACEKGLAIPGCAEACRSASETCAGLEVPEKAEIPAMAWRLPPG